MENTVIPFLRIWRKRISPFYVLGEYAEILSTYWENTQKSFPRTRRKYEYAERICAYSPYTQKGYLRILLLRRKAISVLEEYAHTFPRILLVRLLAYSPKTPIDVDPAVPWLFVDQNQNTFRSHITILHGFEYAIKPFHATVPLKEFIHNQRKYKINRNIFWNNVKNYFCVIKKASIRIWVQIRKLQKGLDPDPNIKYTDPQHWLSPKLGIVIK